LLEEGVKKTKEFEHAQLACFRLLDIRARSRAELKERLEKKGFPAGVIRKVLAKLSLLGLVNDEEFARAWVESRLRFRPAGASALRWELRRRGVSEKTAAAVVKEAIDEKGEFGFALELAQVRLKRICGPGQSAISPGKRELARLGRFLAGRGFSYEVVRQVINKLDGERVKDEP